MRGLAVALLLLCPACGDDDGGVGDGARADARTQTDGAPESDGAPETADAGGDALTLTTFIGLEQAPLVWVAAQDGDGAWSRITSPDGVYHIPLVSDRYGLVYVCEVGVARRLVFFHATTGERPSVVRYCPPRRSPPLGSLSVQVTGLDDDGAAQVAVGNGFEIDFLVASMVDDTVAFDLPVGDQEVVTTVLPDDFSIARVAITVAPVAEGQTTSIQLRSVLDTAAVSNHSVTVGGEDTDDARVGARFLSAGGTRSAPLTQPNGTSYAAVPAALLRDGDLHAVSASHYGADSVMRSATAYLHEAGDVALELPGPFAPDLAAVATEPIVRLEATFDPWPDAEVYWLNARQGDPPGRRHVEWTATAAYLAGAGGGGWIQPDLSDVQGWSDTWGIKAGPYIAWTLTAATASGERFALDLIETADPYWIHTQGDLDGDVVTSSVRGGSFTP